MEIMPSYRPGNQSPLDVKADLVVVAAYEGNKLSAAGRAVDDACGGVLLEHLSRTRSLGGSGLKQFEGKLGQATIVPSMGRLGASAVMVVGLGEENKVTHRQVRRASGVAARGSGGYHKVFLDLSEGVADGAQAAAEGFELGSYTFDKYLTEVPKRSDEVVVNGATGADLKRAHTAAGATIWARDLVNEPPSNRNPEVFADRVAERAKQAGLKVEIQDESDLQRAGMNGILTVGKGSDSPPRFVVVSYEPAGARGFVGLVGKGITFDSGGLSLKTAEGMEKMKVDCSGAAGVVAAITALPDLGPKVRVVAAVALAENMPGGRAAKPGDVIRHYGGRTSEVLNTDAEGRLVLADALAWMSERKPDAMVDMATLTGGMMVALGTKVAGVLSTSPGLSAELLKAAGRTDEPLWELPLIEEYRSAIASTVADIKNVSATRYGSPIFGALFLKDFVGETPWAHLDIAGPAWSDKGEHFLAAGATGYGARLLIDWIEHRASQE
jgi:leucyl aminopeptidase